MAGSHAGVERGLVVGSPILDGFGRGEHALKFPFGNLSIFLIPAVAVIAAGMQVGGFSGDGDGDDVLLGAWHENLHSELNAPHPT